MRNKLDILLDCNNSANWEDPDLSRKAFYMKLMVEVFVDIRDILDKLTTLITIVQSGTPPPD